MYPSHYSVNEWQNYGVICGVRRGFLGDDALLFVLAHKRLNRRSKYWPPSYPSNRYPVGHILLHIFVVIPILFLIDWNTSLFVLCSGQFESAFYQNQYPLL